MRLIIYIVSVVCLVIALFGAASVVNGVNAQAWFIAGVLAYVIAALVPEGYVLPLARRPPPA